VNDELHKELAALAAKLGVSVEHLWGVLVRQAYIDGLSSLLTVFCCAAAGLGVVWFFFYLRRKYKLSGCGEVMCMVRSGRNSSGPRVGDVSQW
jgi:hypothetical protein